MIGGKHRGGMDPLTIGAIALFLLVVGICVLLIAGTEGESAIEWLDWLLGKI